MEFSKKVFRLSSVLLISLLIFSCQKEAEKPLAAYAKGIFVVNEGPFQNGTGTISHYDRDQKVLTNDVFGKENAGAALGNIVQSLSTRGDKVYVVVNNANKIEVAEKNTFKSTGKITGLALPRYMIATTDTKAYLTQWGSDGLSGSVAVLDLTANTVQKTIPLGAGPEVPALSNDKLYVPLSGGFGNDNRVAVISTSTNELVKYITVGDNPTTVVADGNGAIWAICRGMTDWANPTKSTPGGLYKIVGEEVVGTPILLPNGADNLVYSTALKSLFFTADGSVNKYDATSTSTSPTMVLNRNFYKLGIDPVSGFLWGADPKDYVSPGEAVSFRPDGTILDILSVGIIPGSFWFE